MQEPSGGRLGRAEHRKGNLGAQAWPVVERGEATGALEFSERLTAQDATEGCFGGEKTPGGKKSSAARSCFSSANAIFPYPPACSRARFLALAGEGW